MGHQPLSIGLADGKVDIFIAEVVGNGAASVELARQKSREA